MRDLPAPELKAPPERKDLLGRAAGALRLASRLAMGPPQMILQSAPGAGVELLRIDEAHYLTGALIPVAGGLVMM